ncbi:MAG: ATP synthase F0 subunit B [Chloroflexi bacterium]|nr:ATP synthase F0 subunit B [Chloroflexota bacterium]
MDLVDQVRLAIPAEIRHAQRVQQDRERILAQAKEEARRIAEQAAEEASKLADEQPLTQQARARSEQIIAKAYEEAAFMRRESDTYALDTLKNLQTQLQAIEKQVQNGIELLQIGLHTDESDEV